MLQYPGEWKFATTDEIPSLPPMVVYYFHDVLKRIADGTDDTWGVIEMFKAAFGAAGMSTSLDWANTDLRRAMEEDRNAVVFLDLLWSAIDAAHKRGLAVPTVAQINDMLRRNNVGYELRPPRLVRATADAVVAPTNPASAAVRSVQHYTVGELIGRGGFGEVFVATRETSAATFEFAMKVLNPSPFANADRALERFRREVAALQSLQHRGIVAYVDAGVDSAGRPYVVMPRVIGKNIRDWAEGRPAHECIRAMSEVLLALAYAHTNSVLHRDLKPSNVLVRHSDGQPLLLDFGNAYVLDEMDAASLTSTAVGSVGYIPPEVLANPKLRTPLQDIFAAGVIIYELIARRRPDPLAYVPLANQWGTPPALDVALRKALSAAEHRQQSAAQLHEDVIRSFWPN